MSSGAGLKALSIAIKEKRFEPVYLFFGDDEYRKAEALRQLIDAAIDPSTRDFNLEIRRGTEVNAEAIGSLLAMPPMMADRRAVVIRDIGGMKKDAKAMLDRYLERPANDTLLVLVATAGTKLDKDIGALLTAVEFGPPRPDEVPRWIAKHAATRFKLTVTDEAAKFLAGTVGADFSQLVIEIDKLAAFVEGTEIGLADAEAVVGVRRDATMANLLDAVAAKDVQRALKLTPIVLEQPRNSAVLAVMLLTVQLLGIGWLRARRDRGMPVSRLSGDAFTLFKKTGVFLGRPWGEAAQTWVAATAHWSERDVAFALDRLLAADRALKESRVSSEEQLLMSVILEICSDAQRSAA
jgi:DNA polymerase-3 subunit delta